MTHREPAPDPDPARHRPGPRTLAEDIASIQPRGTPEAVREEDIRRAEQDGGIESSDGDPAGPA